MKKEAEGEEEVRKRRSKRGKGKEEGPKEEGGGEGNEGGGGGNEGGGGGNEGEGLEEGVDVATLSFSLHPSLVYGK